MNPQQILALLLEIADLRTERDMLRSELIRRDQIEARKSEQDGITDA